MINAHDPSKGPFFLYAAYQAVHGPLEAPQKYLDQCGDITESDRHIFCGMALALDEGIGNITAALKAKGLFDNTIIALTTDNGGQNGVGGNNWPLRGNKATVFEGGVRGQGFIWGGKDTVLGDTYASNAMLSGSSSSASHMFEGLMHNVDWGPTLYSAGGGDAAKLIDAHKLDGMDMWPAFLQTASSSSGSDGSGDAAPPLAVGPRQDILLHLQGMSMGSSPPMPETDMTAALRSGDWKVVMHQKESVVKESMVNATGQNFLHTASGWVELKKDAGTGKWASRSYEKPTPEQSCYDRVCLFNLKTDPTERVDVSDANPDIVAKLLARIEEYNRTGIPNQKWPFDAKSCPKNFPTNAWTPWLNATPPIPTPKPNVAEGNSVFKCSPPTCDITGWCSGPDYSGPALNVRILLDGQQIANVTASMHRQEAGDHGFAVKLDYTKVSTGAHKIQTEAFYEGTWGDLRNSPVCTAGGKVVACKQ